MRGLKPAILLLSVALIAALIGHVVIDVLGDFLLAHDTYDDVDHSSRAIVALAAFGPALLGLGLVLRAAIREAHGSENAFSLTLRGLLPRNMFVFVGTAIVMSTGILCVMEACDGLLAGRAVDDPGDLFGGSIRFGGTIVALVATIVSLMTVSCLKRLSRARIVAGVVVAFLRRCAHRPLENVTNFEVTHRLVFHAHHICRRIAGRAPPLLLRVAPL